MAAALAQPEQTPQFVEGMPGRDKRHARPPKIREGIRFVPGHRPNVVREIAHGVRSVGFRPAGETRRLNADEEMLPLAQERRPSIMAIDAPLGFPSGMCCLEETCACHSDWDFKGRKCEREPIGRKITVYVTTKRTFIKAMVYRAVRLKDRLRKREHEVIEVYPYTSKACLFGKPVPKRTREMGRQFLHERLST